MMEHCIHDPTHPLAEVYGSEEFHCDGCKTPGNGPRYRCHKCDFNLHHYCRHCPSTLSTFMHPQHQLQLVTGPQARRNNKGFCDLCDDNVEGLFYRCEICDFDIHPFCTKLPEHVPHVLHPDHRLKLHKTSSPGRCSVCENECSSWRYGCRSCSFDIHLDCILARCDASTTTASRSAAAGPSHYGPTHYGPTQYWPTQYGLSHYGPTHYGPTHYGPSHYGPTHYGPHHNGPSNYGPYHSSTVPPLLPYYQSAPAPTHFAAHLLHPYVYAPPPPTYGFAPPPPPTYGAHAHGEHPGGFIPHSANHSLTVSEAQGSGQPRWGKKLGKFIYSLVTNLTAGLLVGAIFGI